MGNPLVSVDAVFPDEISYRNRQQFVRASGLVAAGSVGLFGGPQVVDAGERDVQVLLDIPGQCESPETVLVPDEGQYQKLTLSDGVVSTSHCPHLWRPLLGRVGR